MSSEQRFGYEWNKYSWITRDYERQFRNWTHPLTQGYWNGKKVLDAGCGMGRNSYWVLKYGALSVLAFDNDEQSLVSARHTLAEFSNASVERHNLSQLPWEDKFDIVMCIGVLHHVRRPKLALQNMMDALHKKGQLVVWVYSYEGNKWIVRFINPIRIHITSKLPLPMVHFLSYFCSVPLYMFVKLFKGPTPYLKQLSMFDLWHINSIVFDQLIPDIAHYWKKDEVLSLVQDLPLTKVSVNSTPEGTGWILNAIKK